MSRKILTAPLMLAAVLCAAPAAINVSAQTPAPAAVKPAAAAKTAMPTVDEVVAKYTQALGGADKLKAIQTMKMTGKALIQGQLEAPITIQVKRPGSSRTDLSIQGKTFTQAYDGTTGWKSDPFQGTGDPEKMSADESKSVAEQADFEGSLFDYKTKGSTVELVAKEDFEGTPVYKMKITKKSGDVEYVYLDAANYLPLKTVLKRKMMGTEIEIEAYSGDYKPVNGVMVPHTAESKIGGKSAFQMTLDKVEANVPIDDVVFKMPTPKAAAPAAKP